MRYRYYTLETNYIRNDVYISAFNNVLTPYKRQLYRSPIDEDSFNDLWYLKKIKINLFEKIKKIAFL